MHFLKHMKIIIKWSLWMILLKSILNKGFTHENFALIYIEGNMECNIRTSYREYQQWSYVPLFHPLVWSWPVELISDEGDQNIFISNGCESQDPEIFLIPWKRSRVSCKFSSTRFSSFGADFSTYNSITFMWATSKH